MSKQNTKLIESVSKIAAEAAVEAVMEYLEQQNQEKKKRKVDYRLRNTKLMLRNYRLFKKHCESIPEELQELEEMELNDLIENELVVESIIRSKKRTLAMVRFIDKMLEVYRIMCENSEREEEQRSYQSVYWMYVSEVKQTVEEIATCHKTDPRTVYRDVDRAVKTLSALIFGIDSIYFHD